MPPNDEAGLAELFHENSKISRFEPMPPPVDLLEQMGALWESLPFANLPRHELPRDISLLQIPLGEAIVRRQSARMMKPVPISLSELGTILFSAYGVTRMNEDGEWPRPFRTVPSGGALYPLEIFFHTTYVLDIPAGLYHYNASKQDLCLVRKGDFTREIADALPYPHIAQDASVVVFITAMMERSTFKYRSRGYRFLLLEAGHVAQNINLASMGLGLGSINVGGFYDHEVDAFLGLDGVTHGTVYMAGIGRSMEDRPLSLEPR